MKKSRKTIRRKHATKALSLSKISMNETMDAGKKTLAVLAGIWAGQKAYVWLDSKIGSSPTVQGIFGANGKQIITPLALAAVGLTASQFIKNPIFKYVSYGVAGAAAINLARNHFNLDILSGVENESYTPIGAPSANELSLPKFQEAANRLNDDSIEGIEGIKGQYEDSEGIEGAEYIEVR